MFDKKISRKCYLEERKIKMFFLVMERTKGREKRTKSFISLQDHFLCTESDERSCLLFKRILLVRSLIFSTRSFSLYKIYNEKSGFCPFQNFSTSVIRHINILPCQCLPCLYLALSIFDLVHIWIYRCLVNSWSVKIFDLFNVMPCTRPWKWIGLSN